MDFSNPIVFRGVERLLIDAGAIFSIWVGYKLYVRGMQLERKGAARRLKKPDTNISFRSKLFSLIVSGTGPGIAAMAFGAIVLVTALSTGPATRERQITEANAPAQQSIAPEKAETKPLAAPAAELKADSKVRKTKSGSGIEKAIREIDTLNKIPSRIAPVPPLKRILPRLPRI